MKRRAVISFCFLIALFTGMIFRLLDLSQGETLRQAAQMQSSYVMTLGKTRGTIYDCNLNPLTNAVSLSRAVAIATPESVTAISKALPPYESSRLFEQLQKGRPVLFEWPEDAAASAAGLLAYRLPQRYTPQDGLEHIIGYVGQDGHGVTGIEQSFDTWLSECSGAVSLRYRADALGRALTGESMTLEDTTANSRSGVVLTIDERIQKIAAQAAKNHFSSGAVVVLETGSAKIRAMVSLPDYDPENLSAALEDASSPLVNRVLSAYNTGSVFKLVVACAAADQNETGMTMECTGTTDYAKRLFQCIGGVPHGTVDLSRAVAVSCNCYFIHLADTIGYQPILQMAQKLGFGRATWLANNFCAAAGSLPGARDLSAPAALANFSFGQGELLATPLQIAAMVQAIACGGIYTEPSLVEGRVSRGETVAASAAEVSSRAMTAHTAELVRGYMMDAVENGTVSDGKPETGGAGAKTATAETGSFDADGEAVIQAWCAGFYPAEQPQYVIVVFAENGKSGSRICAPVFKEIADGLAGLGRTDGS